MNEEKAPKCPKCKSVMLYVQRSYEYYDVLVDDVGNIEVLGQADSIVDEEYSPHFLCESCDRPYNLDVIRRKAKEES